MIMGWIIIVYGERLFGFRFSGFDCIKGKGGFCYSLRRSFVIDEFFSFYIIFFNRVFVCV